MEFLPISMSDMKKRGWDAPDFVYVVGEAYVDHPSFGHAIISRVLEHAGYRIAMLCLPEYHSAEDFRRFGKPKLGFLVSSGVIDSMVNHYTAAKKRRNEDAYAPGGKAGMRPDRAVTVYCNRIHEAYPGMPVLIGGVEASLRRFSHYDYWDDKVRRSVLVDSAATLLMYGMGEKTIIDCCDWVRRGMPAHELMKLSGICYMAKQPPKDAIVIPSHDEVAKDPKAYAKAFMLEYGEQDPVRGGVLCQMQDTQRYLVQNPPAMPLNTEELDSVYDLPFTRRAHPCYDKLGGVPALKEVRFSLSAVRGCYGACNFCALTFHQGRIVTARSERSLLKEARLLTTFPDFKGYIHDVGGPTANFRAPACEKQLKSGACKNRQCLYPTPCKNLKVSHRELCQLLEKMRALPKVKKVFIRSGIRFDYVMADKDPAFLRQLCQHHVSGQLKVAPEHISPNVLAKMGKPNRDVYDRFVQKYEQINKNLGLKQYLVPYLMSSHPGSTLNDAILLAEYLRDIGHQPEQVQDFYPTPGTLSTCMYHTGLDPRDMTPVYVPKTAHEKAMQRALLQYKNPRNHDLVREALRICSREDLIGYVPHALVPPERGANTGRVGPNRRENAAGSGGRNAARRGTESKAGSRSGRASGASSRKASVAHTSRDHAHPRNGQGTTARNSRGNRRK
ncbi:MAG: YgiQ family radical SAM protein [Clostridiales bacterium]|nr:YgiQ family radical SAM protein [Clostridiales bacterium]